jgi:hypothetical protein
VTDRKLKQFLLMDGNGSPNDTPSHGLKIEAAKAAAENERGCDK